MFGARFVVLAALTGLWLVPGNVPSGSAALARNASTEETASVRVQVRILAVPRSLAHEHLGDTLANPGAVVLDEKAHYKFLEAFQHQPRSNVLSAPVVTVRWNESAIVHGHGVAWRMRVTKGQGNQSVEIVVKRNLAESSSNLQVTIQARLDSGDALIFGGGQSHDRSEFVRLVTIGPLERGQSRD